MININKFLIFSLAYFILGIISLPILKSILMANRLGIFVILIFFYILIFGIWSIITSSSKQFLISSLFYILLTALMAYDADQNVFWPGRDQTILIAVIVYVVFILIWLGVKFLKKKYKK